MSSVLDFLVARKAYGSITRVYTVTGIRGVTKINETRREVMVGSTVHSSQDGIRMISDLVVFHHTRVSSYPTKGLAEERTAMSSSCTVACVDVYCKVKNYN